MGISPCRRFSLLGIAHPVVGKYFQVLEVHREMKHTQELSCEKGQIMAYSCILKKKNNLDCYSVSIYVRRKSCNKTHSCNIYAVW